MTDHDTIDSSDMIQMTDHVKIEWSRALPTSSIYRSFFIFFGPLLSLFNHGEDWRIKYIHLLHEASSIDGIHLFTNQSMHFSWSRINAFHLITDQLMGSMITDQSMHFIFYFFQHCQKSNSQPVPSQAGADTTRPFYLITNQSMRSIWTDQFFISSLSGNRLTIANVQKRRSGLYQCFCVKFGRAIFCYGEVERPRPAAPTEQDQNWDGHWKFIRFAFLFYKFLRNHLIIQ